MPSQRTPHIKLLKISLLLCVAACGRSPVGGGSRPSGGDELHFPPGTYSCTAELELDESSSDLAGGDLLFRGGLSENCRAILAADSAYELSILVNSGWGAPSTITYLSWGEGREIEPNVEFERYILKTFMVSRAVQDVGGPSLALPWTDAPREVVMRIKHAESFVRDSEKFRAIDSTIRLLKAVNASRAKNGLPPLDADGRETGT